MTRLNSAVGWRNRPISVYRLGKMPIQSCGHNVSAPRGKAGASPNAHMELRAKCQRSAREAIIPKSAYSKPFEIRIDSAWPQCFELQYDRLVLRDAFDFNLGRYAEVAQIITEPIEAGSSEVKGSKATQKVTGVKLADGEVMMADVVVRQLSTPLPTPSLPQKSPST